MKNRLSYFKNQKGMSLIELMISMVIGLIMLSGVITIFINSRVSFHASQSQTTMLSDARFAVHLIRQDVQMAGSYGLLESSNLVTTTLGNLANDCDAGWYIDADTHLFGADDSNPYAGTCIPAAQSWMTNTDIIVARYADSVTVDDGSLSATDVYLRSTTSEGELFSGGVAPVLASETATFPAQNNAFVTAAYYISDYTDAPGDGYPSLHRIRLTSGPSIVDDLIVPGVEDLQFQYGVDDDDDGSVDLYVNADNAAIDWTSKDSIRRIKSVSISLLMVAEESEGGLDTSGSYEYADKVNNIANDGRIRKVITTVIPLLNQIR